MLSTSAFAAPGTDYQSQVEAYLDQIREKVNSIQQSVDAVEEPPLAEQVVEALSFETCASLETLLQVGGGLNLSVPVQAEGEAKPGLAIFSALLKAHAALKTSLSGGLDAGAGVNITVCFDLYKLAKILKEEAEYQTAGVDVGLLGDISQDSRDFLVALVDTNPAALYNTLLAPGVDGMNETLGFNPAMVTEVANAIDDALLTSQFIPNPKTLMPDVEDGLNAFAGILPSPGDLTVDIQSLFNEAQKLNPCELVDQIPFDMAGNCNPLPPDVDDLIDKVSALNNLLILDSIEDALNQAWGFLTTLVDTTVGQIEGVINWFKSQKSILCSALSPVITC